MAFTEETIKEIVRLHDEELLSVRKIAKKLDIAASTIFNYCVSGDIRFKKDGRDFVANSNRGKHHTEKTKRKISESRKRYIEEHPDSMPYKKYHYTNGESYAERYFREWMEKESIKYLAQQQLGLYTLDFLVGNIDLEIDGEQHCNDKRIVESDERRNKYVEEQGLKVIRVRWSHYKKLSQEEKHDFLERLKAALTTDNQLNESFKIDEGKLKKVYGKCKKCGGAILSKTNKAFCSVKCSYIGSTKSNISVDDYMTEDFYKKLIKDSKNSKVCDLSKKYGVSHTSIRRWLNTAKELGYQ